MKCSVCNRDYPDYYVSGRINRCCYDCWTNYWFTEYLPNWERDYYTRDELILILLSQGYTRQDISGILRVSINRVRSIITEIKHNPEQLESIMEDLKNENKLQRN